jgi:hypothetical protein
MCNKPLIFFCAFLLPLNFNSVLSQKSGSPQELRDYANSLQQRAIKLEAGNGMSPQRPMPFNTEQDMASLFSSLRNRVGFLETKLRPRPTQATQTAPKRPETIRPQAPPTANSRNLANSKSFTQPRTKSSPKLKKTKSARW